MTMGRRPKLHKDKSILYYFSDEAKAQLRLDATAAGYISPKNKYDCRGLGTYINAIAQCKFIDTRPIEVAELDNDLMDHNRVPLWNLEYTRRRHALSLSTRAQLALYKLALTHCIANPRRGDSIDHATSVLGCIIEAIGIHWLTPIDPPHAAQLQTATRKAHDNDRQLRAQATATFYQSSY